MRLNCPLACFRCLITLGLCLVLAGCSNERTVVTEHTDYKEPLPARDETFADDEFDPSRAPSFDPERVDPRQEHGWSINLSAAVTKLDVAPLKPDTDQELLRLHSNYRDAIKSVTPLGEKILPSVNLIDGKAKQFDDGLYAALEQYWFQGIAGGFPGDLDLLQRLAKAVPADSRAASYFTVGLNLAGIPSSATNQSAQVDFKKRFESDLLQNKPIGFYTWNEKLQQCYRVARYFQMDFDLDENDWMQTVVRALQQDSDLLATYRQILTRWARLSSTPSRLTINDLVENPNGVELVRIRRERNLTSSAVSLLPAGSNRESELTRRLFPLGLPSDADLMRELVKAIRSGTIDLQPTSDSGWYDYQVYALETLLVPGRAAESNRLLLTANYKRRALEAFQVLMTKRKETHVLRSESGIKTAAAAPPPLEYVSPRLRLEPAPTYYLRMARSYRFLNQILGNLVDESAINQLHGLTEQGIRKPRLMEELKDMQRLFYGCYATSAEDLGLAIDAPEVDATELKESRNHAEKWLADFSNDPDLAVDTRVIVAAAENRSRRTISNWATVGVRFGRLKARYIIEAPPQVKNAETNEWTHLRLDQLDEATYLLPVDEFISVQLSPTHVFTRAEFQQLCNGGTNRDEIIGRLQR